VTVGTSSAGGLTAAFTFSPLGSDGSSVNFNASTSTRRSDRQLQVGLRRWHHHHPNFCTRTLDRRRLHMTLIGTDSKSRKSTTSNTVTVS
jgi:hypothetical protein